jgi:hypothetical protein
VSLLLNRDGGWVDVQSPSVHVGGLDHPVMRGEVFLNGAWVRFFPHEETTHLTVTAGLSSPLSVGVGRTVEGAVAPASGGISGGTVTVAARPVGGSAWTQIGQAAVAPAAGTAHWALTATPMECGDHEFRVTYSGTSVNAASEAPIVTQGVGLTAPVLTGGRIEDEALTFSWPAVPGATAYDVFMDGVLLGEVTAPTATAVRLKPATAYTFTVQAKRGACRSPASAPIVGTTSRSTIQDSGSATIKIDPLKTNSYRPDVAWGYISSNVGQATTPTPGPTTPGSSTTAPTPTSRRRSPPRSGRTGRSGPRT